MSNGSSPSDALSILGKVVGLSLLPAIYLYFAGFSYSYAYFRHFGLSLYAVDAPAYQYILFSFAVFSQNKLITSVVLFFLLFIAVLLYLNKAIGFLLLGVELVVLFPLIYSISTELGTERAALLRHGIGAKRIYFAFDKETANLLPEGFLEANASRQLILISETEDYINVLLQRISKEPDLPRASVFKVPKDKILLARITINETRRIEL